MVLETLVPFGRLGMGEPFVHCCQVTSPSTEVTTIAVVPTAPVRFSSFQTISVLPQVPKDESDIVGLVQVPCAMGVMVKLSNVNVSVVVPFRVHPRKPNPPPEVEVLSNTSKAGDVP